MEGWPSLRPSKSEHHLAQDARIYALLEEMRPARRPAHALIKDTVHPSAPPKYATIFQMKNRPPTYSQLKLHPTRSSWVINCDQDDIVALPSWEKPRPFTRYESSLENYVPQESGNQDKLLMTKIIRGENIMPSTPMRRFSMESNSHSSNLDSSGENHSVGCKGITPRNTPRQASFIAAIARHSSNESSSLFEDRSVHLMECNYGRRSSMKLAMRASINIGESLNNVTTTSKEYRRTTIYGDEIYAKCSKRESIRDRNHNDSPLNTMRRTRPKSYVLATSTSLPETVHPASLSQDESRELSSIGSLSSIDRSSRSAHAPQPPSSLKIQKIISLFSHQRADSPVKRSKRSRTSLPSSRNPLPDTTLRYGKVVRQGWIKHQKQALGRSGKRRHWEDSWAVLCDRNLYLCPHEPTVTIIEKTKDKLIHIAQYSRIDVLSSIVDIAYEWLAGSKTKHVIRLVTQNKIEHLFELSSETEMLSWIATLQTSSDGTLSPQLHSSYSAASLTSSSSTPSERNGHATSATNQLIMHRYKAKSSQLQSPVAGKRAINDGHYAQPGTSKDSSSGENGEPSTPKSGRKWKKSKAGKQGSGGSVSGQQPTGTQPQSVLGIKLADCIMAGPDEYVPLLVQICVGVVEAYGLDTVGIYRIPGNTAAVNALKETLSHGFDTVSPENLDFADPRWRDVNVVSSLLKMFLRKLPEPLLTDKLYPFFIDANRISSHHNRLHKLRNLLRKLPRHHYATLRYLIFHLAEITRNSQVNKMETRNLALMFGPSIVRPSDDNMATMVTHMSDQCKIIETLIHYHDWMFDDSSTVEDDVPDQHPSETGPSALEAPQYGVGVPTGVSAASFNDMHNLIRKANEDQAAAMMNEGKTGKIKNILRRNSRRDRSKSKLKIESTAPAAINPRNSGALATPTQSSVDSTFCGNYQERDIDAEIISRQTVSQLATSSIALEQSPSIESSLGSLPDTSRTDPGSDIEQMRRKRQEDIYSARRIFIAGSAAAATSDDTRAIDALASHTHHLNLANSPALEVLSEETREKIRRMQRKQTWIERPAVKAPSEPKLDVRTPDYLKTCSPTKDMTDALSCTSDYSTTSSAPLTAPLAVACLDPPLSSDYASSNPSPCARNVSTSPRVRPQVLALQNEARCQQKIRLRNKAVSRDSTRRHTLSDMDTLKESHLEKFARWFGLRKSSPDVSELPPPPVVPQPAIIRTSPNELTPASGDEQL